MENGNLSKFRDKLTTLINQHCLENIANVPDYILAKVATDAIESFCDSIKTRDKWFNFKPFQQLTELNDEHN